MLASDAHVVIGDVSLVLPLVALPEYLGPGQSFSLDRRRDREQAAQRLSAFRLATSRPATAPTLDEIEVKVRAYGLNDADTSFRRVCPLLRRQWSRAVCDDPWAPLTQAMPENRVYLVDVRKLEAFDGHFTIGLESMADQLRRMRLKFGQVSTVCDKAAPHGTRFCTAAVRIDGNLAAAWTVWDNPEGGETHEAQARRESRAVLAFVSHAVGTSEDFAQVQAAACASRRPGSRPGPQGPDLCAGQARTSG